MSPGHIPIGEISFFRFLSAEDLITIMGYTQTKEYEAQDVLFTQGDKPDGLYVVLSGRVKVYIYAMRSTTSTVVKTAEPGDYIGEFGLLDGMPRSASAKAEVPTSVLYLPAQAFEIILLTRPSVAVGVARQLIEMVKAQTGQSFDFQAVEAQMKSGRTTDLTVLRELCKVLRDRNIKKLSTG